MHDHHHNDHAEDNYTIEFYIELEAAGQLRLPFVDFNESTLTGDATHE